MPITLGPEDVSPAVPSDSPRIARGGHAEREDDRALAHLRREVIARDPNGHEVKVPLLEIKSGWTVVGDVPKRETHSLWREPARVDRGMVGTPTVHRIANSIPAKVLEGKGWTRIGPAPIEKRAPLLSDDSREALGYDLDSRADTLGRPGRQLYRQRFVEGEWHGRRDPGGPVATPRADRYKPGTFIDATKKPEDGEP